MSQSSSVLRIGDVVPDFDAKTTQGEINFYSQIHDNWAILFAFPDDFTPVATTELASFTELQSEFAQRRVKLFALSTENSRIRSGQFKSHKKWVDDINEISRGSLLFPIITDDDGSISLKFNVLDESDAEAVQDDEAVGEGVAFKSRTVFVIDDKKRLRLVFNYPAAVGLNTAEVLRVVDCLQTAARADVRTPANWVPGRVVVVPPRYNDEAAKQKFAGFVAVKPYLRLYSLPEEMTSVPQLPDLPEKAVQEFLDMRDEPETGT